MQVLDDQYHLRYIKPRPIHIIEISITPLLFFCKLLLLLQEIEEFTARAVLHCEEQLSLVLECEC